MPGHQGQQQTTPEGPYVAECKHKCKNKENCGHACCKRHLSSAAPLKTAQRKVAEATNHVSECKHTCSNKLACGHPCCKRHLSQETLASQSSQQTRPNLQLVEQRQRKDQQSKVNSGMQKVRQVAPRPQLTVQGRSLSSCLGVQGRAIGFTSKFRFFMYDIESTGLSPTGDRIVEIAMKDSASPQQYATLVSCAPATVHRGAYRAHGISTRQSHQHGLPFKQVAAGLVQFVKKNSQADEVPVLVAHNGKNFDNRMLAAEFKRSGIPLPQNWHWLDTLPLARKLLPELLRHSQADLRAHFELPPPLVAHRAAADVEVLQDVVKGLARVAGAADLQSLITLHGLHKGSFEVYADIVLKEESGQ